MEFVVSTLNMLAGNCFVRKILKFIKKIFEVEKCKNFLTRKYKKFYTPV